MSNLSAIQGCNYATNFEELMQSIASGKHDVNLKDFERRMVDYLENYPLGVPGIEDYIAGFREGEDAWDWGWVRALISDGTITENEVDNMIHRGLR